MQAILGYDLAPPAIARAGYGGVFGIHPEDHAETPTELETRYTSTGITGFYWASPLDRLPPDLHAFYWQAKTISIDLSGNGFSGSYEVTRGESLAVVDGGETVTGTAATPFDIWRGKTATTRFHFSWSNTTSGKSFGFSLAIYDIAWYFDTTKTPGDPLDRGWACGTVSLGGGSADEVIDAAWTIGASGSILRTPDGDLPDSVTVAIASIFSEAEWNF